LQKTTKLIKINKGVNSSKKMVKDVGKLENHLNRVVQLLMDTVLIIEKENNHSIII